jgi:hypothetical protein
MAETAEFSPPVFLEKNYALPYIKLEWAQWPSLGK